MSTLTVMGIEILLVSFAFVFFGRTIFRSLTILLFTFCSIGGSHNFSIYEPRAVRLSFLLGLYYGFAAAMRIAGILLF